MWHFLVDLELQFSNFTGAVAPTQVEEDNLEKSITYSQQSPLLVFPYLHSNDL